MKLFEDKDEQPFFLAGVEVDVHWSQFFELSESIFEHGYVSARIIVVMENGKGCKNWEFLIKQRPKI